MTNPADPPDLRRAERALVIGYAPDGARAGLAALLALDETLAGVFRTAREPVLVQLRLAWWRDALVALGDTPSPRDPALAAIAEHFPLTAARERLATMPDAWEALLDDPVDLATHADRRGAGLFLTAAAMMGDDPSEIVAVAGRGWALADMATHWSDPVVAARVRSAAETALARALAERWPTRLRALGGLALNARADLAGVPLGSPRRVARLAWHRLTGR